MIGSCVRACVAGCRCIRSNIRVCVRIDGEHVFVSHKEPERCACDKSDHTKRLVYTRYNMTNVARAHARSAYVQARRARSCQVVETLQIRSGAYINIYLHTPPTGWRWQRCLNVMFAEDDRRGLKLRPERSIACGALSTCEVQGDNRLQLHSKTHTRQGAQCPPYVEIFALDSD